MKKYFVLYYHDDVVGGLIIPYKTEEIEPESIVDELKSYTLHNGDYCNVYDEEVYCCNGAVMSSETNEQVLPIYHKGDDGFFLVDKVSGKLENIIEN